MPSTPNKKITTPVDELVTPIKKASATPIKKTPMTPVKVKKLTHYNVLHVLPTATEGRIGLAHRAIVKKMEKHGATVRQRKAVQKAAEIMNDPIKRAAYDKGLAVAKRKKGKKGTARESTSSKKRAKKVDVDSDGDIDGEYDDEAGSDDGESDYEAAYGDLEETGGLYKVRLGDGTEVSLEQHARACGCNFGEEAPCVKIEYEED